MLLKILAMKIKDSKFLNLIRKFLKSGYMENWKYGVTYSGTPQGGILSPILANIYLNELDNKIAEIKPKFDKVALRTRTREYNKASWEVIRIYRQLSKTTDESQRQALILELKKKEKLKVPSKDTSDKKLVYVRYADDFLNRYKWGIKRIAVELNLF